MPAPISIQLATLRPEIAADYAGTVRRLAEIGYVAVEPLGFPGITVDDACRLYAELGLEVGTAHLPLPLGEQREEVLETADKLDCKWIVYAGFGPDNYRTSDDTKASCEQFNQAAANAAVSGHCFAIHNHWAEFEVADDGERRVYQYMLDYLEPNVFFQVDVYWARCGGANPVAAIRELGARAPLIHTKDGPCTREGPMTAVGGGGLLDFFSIVEAAGDHAEWLVVELDRCATDMMGAVADSYSFLVGNGLARGNRPVAAEA